MLVDQEADADAGGAFFTGLGDENHVAIQRHVETLQQQDGHETRHSGLSSWRDGLTIGRQWRAALEGRPMLKGPPIGARIFLLAINLCLVFFLICLLIVTLGAAVDPHQTTGLRILSGVSATLVFLMLVIRVWQGVLALPRT